MQPHQKMQLCLNTSRAIAHKLYIIEILRNSSKSERADAVKKGKRQYVDIVSSAAEIPNLKRN